MTAPQCLTSHRPGRNIAVAVAAGSAPCRPAFTLRETVVILLVMALCITLLVMTALRRTELMRRARCRDNLYAILQAGMSYAHENGDLWPAAPHPQATKARVGEVEYVQAIGSYRGRAGDPQAGDTGRMSVLPTRLSTTRNLWTLFRLDLIERDKFICPSTTDVANQEPNAKDYWDFGVGDIDGPATPEQSRTGYAQISYGYQVPYGQHARPSHDLWLCWLVADKGPYGAELEAGAAPPPPFPTAGAPRSWRPWNSPNHGGEGQHALHVETMVEFGTSAGWGADNIYTQAPLPPVTARYGMRPTPGRRLVPAPRPGFNDTLIYP